jgi:hypothetical protein
MAKYGKLAQDKISKNLHEHKHQGKFTSKKQAIAAGISQARQAGGKVPSKGRG